MIYKKGSNLISKVVYLTTLTALLVLDSSKLIRAGIIQGYTPPTSPDRLQRTEGSGSRGCSKNEDVALDLVVPNDHVATTVLGHPTFLWRVSAPAEISFTLVEPGVAKPILEKQLEVKTAGFVQVKVPHQTPELQVGKEYRWTVSVICNEKRPSENVYAQALIKRVEATPTLVQHLKSTANERDRASIYAKNGVWYDAIATTFGATQKKPGDPLAAEYFQQLLTQIGIFDLTTQKRHNTVKLPPN